MNTKLKKIITVAAVSTVGTFAIVKLLQKFAKIGDVKAGEFITYNEQSKQLESKQLPLATSTRAGIITGENNAKLMNIDTAFKVAHQFNPASDNLQDAIKDTISYLQKNYNTGSLVSGTMFWRGMYFFNGYIYGPNKEYLRFNFTPVLSNGTISVRFNQNWYFN